jgi:monoamine oxidase
MRPPVPATIVPLVECTFDVIVIGAGAAGLAAGAALARAGRSVLVLEARSRVGGRAWTCRMPGLDVPVELGAEFVHGAAKTTLGLLRKAGMGTVASGRRSRYLAAGRMRSVDAFAEAQAAMQDRALLQARDLSVAEYLDRRPLPARTKTFARMMVEGFDAADPERASARDIAEEWNGGDALLGAQPRLRKGYGAALEWLARVLLTRGARLRMDAAVREVRWRPGEVKVATDSAVFLGRKAVISLPLGVLQAGLVRFVPRLQKEDALRSLASGPVVKAALRFPTAFWEKRHRGIAFFHLPGAPFPTVWTLLPARAPVLIAWAGGPKAQRLSGGGHATLLAAVRDSLKSLFGRIDEPDQAYVHDWASDPYARGAYSYVLVNGQGARKGLAQPLADTLFFAGEATSLHEAGTVSGALQSGERAAREALR